MNRYYVTEKLQKGKSILSGAEAHHLTRVMRGKKGDHLELVDGKGTLAQGTLFSSNKHETIVEITACEKQQEPAPKIVLAAALIKQSRLEWLIEKGTELGATAFHLFASDHSERQKLSSNHLARLETATISALKQCKRLYLPKIEVFSTFPEAKGKALFGDLDPNAPPLTAAKGNTTIYIGPEGGFSENELTQLREFATGVRLSRHVLRAETAGISALAVLG
ncbi:MAG: RsmE family RNA methyltransferase [Candidatus Algichlamydia australiensis]|nr:RsmE family RNA methyltransferase [Chlamydiales bacterium]